METTNKTFITVQTTINAAAEKVWKFFNEPQHIVRWAFASPDWHTTKAENDLHPGGKFLYRMEAKDGSFSFDFSGVYDEIKQNELISYTLDDARSVSIAFSKEEEGIKVIQTFEAEHENSVEMQQMGWQAILDNFKNYTEAQSV